MNKDVPQSRPRLLVADDDPQICNLLESIAQDMGFEVFCETEGSSVVSSATRFAPQIVMLDLKMPDTDGIAVLSQLADLDSKFSVVLVSGMDERTLNSAREYGKTRALDMGSVLQKPMSVSKIQSSLQPFLDAPVLPQAIEKPPVQNEKGFGFLFETEKKLSSPTGTCTDRLYCVPSWEKDDGSILVDDGLDQWLQAEGASLGFSNLCIDQLAYRLVYWSLNDYASELVLPINRQIEVQPHMPDKIENVLSRLNIDREKVIFQFCDSPDQANGSRLLEVLACLSLKNIRTAVSVKGCNEEILSRVLKLTAEMISIDMTCLAPVSAENFNADDEFNFSSFVSLAKKNGMKVTGENVRSDATLHFMKRCGFNYARGRAVSSRRTFSELAGDHAKRIS